MAGCTRYLVRVRGTRYQIPGTRYVGIRYQGIRYQVPDTRYVIPGTWDQGAWYFELGTRYRVPGTLLVRITSA